jgi:hypothetical protein
VKNFVLFFLAVKTMESMKLNKNSTKLGNRVCIIQGKTASGKSYVIFAKVLGKQLIIYQMNPDSSLSIFFNQSIKRK